MGKKTRVITLDTCVLFILIARAPFFQIPIANIIDTFVNANVTLPCVSTIDESVRWLFDKSTNEDPREISTDGLITPRYRDRFSLAQSISGLHSLRIHEVQIADSGTYVCEEDDGIGIKHYISLIVKEISSGWNHINTAPTPLWSSSPDSTRSDDALGSQNDSLWRHIAELKVGLYVILGIVLSIIMLLLIAVLVFRWRCYEGGVPDAGDAKDQMLPPQSTGSERNLGLSLQVD